MKKIVKLNEDDLKRIVMRVMNEQESPMVYAKLPICKPGDSGKLVLGGSIYALSSGKPFCRIETNAAQGGGSKPTPMPKPAQGGGSKPTPMSKPAQGGGSKPAQGGGSKLSPQGGGTKLSPQGWFN